MSVVNSWNEWGHLRHVIIGRCVDRSIKCEPALVAKLAGGAKLDPRAKTEMPQSAVDAGNAQLDAFAALLESHDVKVDRPTNFLPEEEKGIVTPYFEAETMFGCMPPRDVMLTVGHTIIEAPMSWRCRYWEGMMYRPLIQQYWDADRRMKWYQAPKPQLKNSSYFQQWAQGTDAEREAWIGATPAQWCLTEEEILFDAADCLRFGHDLFVQECATTNRKGAEWLRRQLPECRVHNVNFGGLTWPTHLDAIMYPLRPGLALLSPERKMPAEQRELFEDHGWELVPSATPAHSGPVPGGASSKWLSMNMLNLDEHRVFVEASETHQIEQLKDLGMEAIPVPLRDAYRFGGGLHCSSLDVWRDSRNECFFADMDSDASTLSLGAEPSLVDHRPRYRTVEAPDYGCKDQRVYETVA